MNEIKTLYIDAGLHMRVKIQAAKDGTSIRELTEQALDYYLSMQEAVERILVDTRERYDTKGENHANS